MEKRVYSILSLQKLEDVLVILNLYPSLKQSDKLVFELGSDHVVAIHLTLIPYLKAAEELKTKLPSILLKELLEAGIQPDILVCRTEYALNDEIRKKLALFCNVQIDHVIESLDAEVRYVMFQC